MIATGANGPCTRVSATTSRTAGKRVVTAATTSPRAAASTPVRRPTARGKRGSRRLRSAAKSPSAASARAQSLERRGVVARADALDRGHAEAQLAPRLVELEAAHRLDALSLGEHGRERVEAAPRHRRGEAGAALGILQGEEHRRPRGVPPELGDLPLDPHVAHAREVAGEPSVEGRDGVDLARRGLLHAAERNDRLDGSCDRDSGRLQGCAPPQAGISGGVPLLRNPASRN